MLHFMIINVSNIEASAKKRGEFAGERELLGTYYEEISFIDT